MRNARPVLGYPYPIHSMVCGISISVSDLVIGSSAACQRALYRFIFRLDAPKCKNHLRSGSFSSLVFSALAGSILLGVSLSGASITCASIQAVWRAGMD